MLKLKQDDGLMERITVGRHRCSLDQVLDIFKSNLIMILIYTQNQTGRYYFQSDDDM